MTKRLLFLALFAASTAFAAPVITSVTPNVGPAAGGTRVVIKGTGFSHNCIVCSPPFAGPNVLFGELPPVEARFIDSTTVEVVTPPFLPLSVDVQVTNLDNTGSFTLPNAFRYTGNAYDGLEPVLFPIFTPPVKGAFGSEFRTTARIWSKSETTVLYGYESGCTATPPATPFGGMTVPYFGSDLEMSTACSRTTGRLFFVSGASYLVANLRVHDVSRAANSHGTEIPVVRRDDFSTGTTVLIGIPTDPRFRLTLRIYSYVPTFGPVYDDVHPNMPIFLRPGNMFEPSYAEVTNIPPGTSRITLYHQSLPVWAFISVTNNETQEITTITPN